MGNLLEFKIPKKRLKTQPLKVLSTVGFLLAFCVALIPFFLVSIVFYWTLKPDSKQKLKNLVYVINYDLEYMLRDLENDEK